MLMTVMRVKLCKTTDDTKIMRKIKAEWDCKRPQNLPVICE